MEVALLARDLEHWLRDSWSVVAHQRMDDAFRESSYYSVGKAIAAAGLGIPSGQVCDNDLQDLRLILVRCGDVL
jgi:uncharacterized protein GlcG (DUF336 family)